MLRKVQGDLIDQDDVGEIQRQTVRLHALLYKPYDSDEKNLAAIRSQNAVLHAITHNTYVHDVFDEVFDDVHFDCAVGLAGGPSYIANIGKHGERELISLGSCANLAAKVLGDKGTITITRGIYDDLPASLQEHFKKGGIVGGVQTFRSTGLRWSSQPELAKEFGVSWSKEKWHERTEQYRDDLPLDEIEILEATVRIDVHSLTERNCKRTEAVTIYADLDGFTRYVQEAENDENLVSLIRQFHMIRAEFHSVIGSDYEGIVLQHRGDCILAILHLPAGDDKHAKRCDKAVDVAIALQSSMEHVLNEYLKDRKDIHLAVGMDIGKAFVTRLGKKGQRISICFGPEVSNAEQLQRSTGGKRIRVSDEIYDRLCDEDVKEEFKNDSGSYVAIGLTFPMLDEKREDTAARAGDLGASVEKGKVVITTSAPTSPGVWHNSKPWFSC